MNYKNQGCYIEDEEAVKEENIEFYKGKCEAYQEIIKKLIERGV